MTGAPPRGRPDEVALRGPGGRARSLKRVLTRKPRPIFYSSRGERAIVNTAWIDRPVDTRGLHSLLPRPP